MKLFAALLALFFLAIGCGYKPASHYTREALGQNVFVDIKISLDDPQTGPVLIDALNAAIVSRFGKRLVSREEADTTIVVTSGSYSASSLQTDADGFTILYRMTVSMTVVVNSEKLKNRVFSVSGSHDFSVEPSSVLSDAAKNAAARQAALKALDMLTARLILLSR